MSQNQNEMIIEIAKLILTNKKKMIKEDDLIRFYDKSTKSDFDEIFNNLHEQFNKLGFELIKTEFQGNYYYVLTLEGKDDNLTPSQYGILALIAALSKEVNENIKIEELKEIFQDQWNSDIKILLDNDYLRKIDRLEIVKITPLGKAILKEILPDLSLDNLLDIFENDK